MVNELVFVSNDSPVTSSLLIAEGTENQHKNVLELIRNNIDDLEEFGLVAFQTRARLEGQHGGGNMEYALLNEQQATLLITYMRNSPTVRSFKKALVKAFFEMRDQLNKPQSNKHTGKTLSQMSSLELFNGLHGIAKLIGLNENQCTLSANNAVKKLTGDDFLKTINQVHLINEPQQEMFTPTELGKQIGCSAMAFNKKLEELGLQTKIAKQWVPTSTGKSYVISILERII